MSASLEFLLPPQLAVDELLARVKDAFRHRADAPRMLQRSWYDSFDWRLYSNKSILEVTRDSDGHMLVWRALQDNHVDSRLKVQHAPRFARELPQGRFRKRLEALLEMRELAPKVRIRSRISSLRILNNDDKTVARLVIEESTLPRQQGTRSTQLRNRATIIPVKGYLKPARQMAAYLQELGLTLATDDLMQVALSCVGRVPCDYSSKLELTLEPAMRADRATKAILHRLLDIMLQNEAGTRTGTDSEFLHDFRVAIRRTRSALTQIKRVFPKRVVKRHKNEFAWLGLMTGPSRDLDVYLLGFDEYRDSLPASMQADIEPLRDFLIRHQRDEHKVLVKALASARYRRLIKNWRSFLDLPVNERSTLKNAGRPVIEVASKRIWRIYRLILREGTAIKPETPAAALHELRKTCKKLRYLMEFFQSLYPAARICELIKVLKVLQDNLGDFQDYEVQVTTLKKYSHQMMAENNVSADTLLAMGMLIEGLERRQQQAREAFSGTYAGFSEQANVERFRTLFASSH